MPYNLERSVCIRGLKPFSSLPGRIGNIVNHTVEKFMNSPAENLQSVSDQLGHVGYVGLQAATLNSLTDHWSNKPVCSGRDEPPKSS